MKYVICSYKITKEIENNLLKLGLTPLKLRGVDRFGEEHPLNYHPDMFCFHLKDNTWIFYEGAYKNNQEILDKLNLEIIIENDPVSGNYPDYIGLNCAEAGKSLICAKKHANKKILEYAENIIDVKQGYARCSVCILGEAIITADKNICKNFTGDKLLIKAGSIDLFGYDYGFIGGCSGFFAHKLLFTGDIESHPDFLRIKDFCENNKTEIISLSREKLRDYGGLFIF
jgi:hypothetical protein